MRFAAAGLVLWSANSAWAVELPTAWSICKADADCVEVSSACGESQAVHHDYKTQALEKICMTEDCKATGCDGSGRHAWAIKCVHEKCTPDFDAKIPEQNMRFELKDLRMECPKDHPNCGISRTKN